MARTKALTRKQLTGPPDLEEVEVEKLGGGGVIYVRPLPVELGFSIWRDQEAEAEDFDPENPPQRNFEDVLPDLCVYGVVDEDGNRILEDDDRKVVMGWPIGDARTIAEAVMDVSGMSAEGQEELEGN